MDNYDILQQKHINPTIITFENIYIWKVHI